MLTFSCRTPGPRRCSLDVAGYSHSVDAISGDHIDLVLSASGTKLTMILGDATGHGPSAGLIAAEVIGSIRCLATQGTPPDQLLTHANRILTSRVKSGFVCAAVVQIDLLDREAIYSSAGHNGFQFRRGNPTVQLPSNSLPLGFDPRENFTLNSLGVIGFGEIIALFSDGLFETRGNSGQILGTPSIVAQIERSRDRSAIEIARSVEEIRTTHQGNGPMQDDTSFIVMKVSDTPSRRSAPSHPGVVNSTNQNLAATAG